MRGSAMGLSLLTGAGLGETVVDRPPMRLCIMTLGSADDPSSFTLFSPNIVVVTGLLRIRPRNPGNFCDTDEAEEAVVAVEAAILVVLMETASVDGAGWGKLCIDPHNFLTERDAGFVRVGGDFAEAVEAEARVLLFVVAGTRLSRSLLFVATGSAVIVGFSLLLLLSLESF